MRKKNIKIQLLVTVFFGLLGVLLISTKLNSSRPQEFFGLNRKQKDFIKKFILPYKLINQQEKIISDQTKNLEIMEPYLQDLEFYKKQSGTDIEINRSIINLSNNKILKKFDLTSGFYSGIFLWSSGNGSAFIDFYDDNLIIISARGVLAYSKNIDHELGRFKQIKSNLEDFIDLEQFKKLPSLSIKDLLIFKDKIFVSYTEEIKKDCWNTSVLTGDMNYKTVIFKELFSSNQCIHSTENQDNEFQPLQSGGRMIGFQNNEILLTTGDYRSRYLAQDKESINGKILKISLDKNEYKILSMGHRNPQGLYFDRAKNLILETEHGPMGGDEINLIKIDSLSNKEIPNYGWAISSAGEHYSYITGEKRKITYKKYPLHKSHSDYGFIEPLKSFVPSIAISEIVGIGKDKYIVSSLKDKSLYFFELDKNKKIINLKRVDIQERIRDLKFKDNHLYMFLEDTSSIGILDTNLE